MDFDKRTDHQVTNGVRLRVGKEHEANNVGGDTINNRNSKHRLSTNARRPLPTRYLLFVIGLYFIIYYVQRRLENKLPTPLLLEDVKEHKDRFIAERAMDFLVRLTDLGPRVAGSYENEVLAVDLLKKDIQKIIKVANKVHNIELDLQVVSGSYPLTFLEGLTNYYRNVQNVIVKIGPKPYSPHSVLINCHFDSVSDSPGGSDDGASCAIMLEILHVLATNETPLKHNIILLFNSAEENLMHASHGFITQHKWAKEIGAFINLEACGAGGREVLFQSGPNSPWLMKEYANNVPYPYASSVAQEVFQSGIIPGDTDFRVFRDFGNVSGLDFAWASNGYVYHTKYDNVEQIPLGTLQRTGDNILALARGMTSAEEMKDVQSHKPGNLVYFDVFGKIVVRWPHWFGTLLNIVSSALSILIIYWNYQYARSQGISVNEYKSEMMRALGVTTLCAVANAIVTLIIAGFISQIGRSMSWFANPLWVFFLYALPCVITPLFIFDYFTDIHLKVVKTTPQLFQLYHDAYQISWTSLLMLSVLLGVRSGYVPWLWVISPTVGTFAQMIFFKNVKVGSVKWLVIYIGSMLFGVVQSINMIEGCLDLFIPIMGRIGSNKNPEVIIGIFTSSMFGLFFTYVSPLIFLTKTPKKVIAGLSTVFLGALVLLIFTPLGFPYSGDISSPRPQRYMLLHTERTFHNKIGDEVGAETGYWVVDLDYNSPHTVKPYVPEMSRAQPVTTDCDKHLYCGLPYLMPIVGLISTTHWIPGPPPDIPVPTTMKVLSKKRLNDTLMRIEMEITGPDHMALMISPKPGVRFHSWNLNKERPVRGKDWNHRETYFIYYACHADPVPWLVSIDFEVPPMYNDSLMDIALTSHFLHGHHQRNLEFKKFLAHFPPWTTVTGWTATYKSWTL